MHIVILIDAYLPVLGGAQNNVHAISRRLVTNGYQITVLTRHIEATSPKFEVLDGVMIRRYGTPGVRLLSKLWLALGSLWLLIRKRDLIDVMLSVPIFYWPDLLPIYLAHLANGKPYLMRSTMTRNFETLLSWRVEGAAGWLKRVAFPPFVWRRVLQHAAAIITQTDVVEAEAQRYGIGGTQLIYNGVDTSHFKPATDDERRDLRAELRLPQDRVLAICTGRFVKSKNQIVLLQALARLAPDYPLDVVLLGIDAHNKALSNRAQLVRFSAENNLDSRVHLRDNVTNVADYLRAADIFVFPTMFDEGMSNALLEAMACGLPAVCSEQPQLRSVFPPEQGYFFEPADVAALAQQLRGLLDSAELRAASGQASARWVCERFELNDTIMQYERLLQTVGQP